MVFNKIYFFVIFCSVFYGISPLKCAYLGEIFSESELPDSTIDQASPRQNMMELWSDGDDDSDDSDDSDDTQTSLHQESLYDGRYSAEDGAKSCDTGTVIDEGKQQSPDPLSTNVLLLTKSVREQRILTLLMKKSVCFSDVKHISYYSKGKKYFQADILQVMHNGADICETEPGYYYYSGETKVLSTPSESVAIAMFQLLNKREMLLFDLRFQLYLKGYIKYTPMYLAHLELALAVGNVHPYRRKIHARNRSDACPELREIWEKIKGFSDENFDAYLHHPTEEKHVDILEKRHNRRILLRLRDMFKEKTLDRLEHLSADLAQDMKQKPYQIAPRDNRKQKLLQILQNNKNEAVYIKDLLKIQPFSLKGQGAAMLLGVIVSLTRSDFPIVYDKENGTVTLLEREIPSEKPQEGTNLLTMIYDLEKRWGSVNCDELAYYAYRGGYWLDFSWGQRTLFNKCVNHYKESLAILGHINICSCIKNRHTALGRQRKIWNIAKEEGGVKKDPEHYRTTHCLGATQEDIKAILALETSLTETAFITFQAYLEEQSRARSLKAHQELIERSKIVEGFLRQGPKPALFLWGFCAEEFGIKEGKDVWEIAGVLTGRKDGRLLYNPQTTVFCWDDKSSAPTPSQDMLVAEVFSLKQSSSYMPDDIFCHILKQQGFQDVSAECVQKIQAGLEVLGLSSLKSTSPSQARVLTNLMLQLGVNTQANMPEKNHAPYHIGQTAEMVVQWVHNGSFSKLWQCYEEKRDGSPSMKRRKLDVSVDNPEDVIRREIPQLYTFLKTISPEK